MDTPDQTEDQDPVVHVLAWFNQMQLADGLLESAEHSNIVSLYDNALAALAFIAAEQYDKAEAIFDFFNQRIDTEMRSGAGGFHQFRNAEGNPSGPRWMGDNAWLLIALENYAAHVDSDKYRELSTALKTWIRDQQDTDGGIWGGTEFDGSQIGKVTENMIDVYSAIEGYDGFHRNLLRFLKDERWNASDKLLMASPGDKYQYALDNHTWGYCTFEDFPVSVVEKTEMYKNTRTATVNQVSVTGFAPDIDKDVVWLEGTGQVVVAYQKAGDIGLATTYIDKMTKALIASPSFPGALGLPYSANPGTGYGTGELWAGADTQICISSSAWYLFALLEFDPMAVHYNRDTPAVDKFWLN